MLNSRGVRNVDSTEPTLGCDFLPMSTLSFHLKWERKGFRRRWELSSSLPRHRLARARVEGSWRWEDSGTTGRRVLRTDSRLVEDRCHTCFYTLWKCVTTTPGLSPPCDAGLPLLWGKLPLVRRLPLWSRVLQRRLCPLAMILAFQVP